MCLGCMYALREHSALASVKADWIMDSFLKTFSCINFVHTTLTSKILLSVISSDPPSKDGDDRFTTVP